MKIMKKLNFMLFKSNFINTTQKFNEKPPSTKHSKHVIITVEAIQGQSYGIGGSNYIIQSYSPNK